MAKTTGKTRLVLTDQACRRLKPGPEGERREYWDMIAPALCLRVGPRRRTWYLMTRVLTDGEWRLRRIRLGAYPTTSLADARTAAQTTRETAEAGRDPGQPAREARAALEARSRDTFARIRDRFLDGHLTRRGTRPAPATLSKLRRLLNAPELKAWESRPLTELTRRDVREILEEIAPRAPVHANRTLDALRNLFRWAIAADLLETDPTATVRPPGIETPRSRVLTLEELAALWRATDDGDLYSDLVRALLLTGARRGEWGDAAWSEFVTLPDGGDCLAVPAARTKGRRDHLIPLADPLLELLERRRADGLAYVFGNNERGFRCWAEGKRAIDRRLPLDPWTLHDLRRSWSTHAHERLRIAPHVAEACIGHRGASRSGVSGVYNRSEYLAERRAAMDSYSRFILSLAGELPASNVRPLSPRRA